jgi:hypothetical protein
MIRWWWLLLIAAGVAASACSSGQAPLAHSPSRQVITGAWSDIHSLPPDVTYPAEGINVSARPPAAHGKFAADAISPGAALAAFKAQGDSSLVGSALRTERPAIVLRTITELHPTALGVRPHASYPGWVVIYRHIRLVSYGPHPFPRNYQGTFVAIMDAATGQWTNFFDHGSLRPTTCVMLSARCSEGRTACHLRPLVMDLPCSGLSPSGHPGPRSLRPDARKR